MASEARLDVRYSEAAASQVSEALARGEARPGTAHASYWRAMKRLLEKLLPLPEHALAPGTALRDDLVPLRRVKFGRHRLVFVASPEKRLAIVLLIGFRKEGDKRDVYEDVRRRARRGDFDGSLAEVGAAAMGRR